MSDREREKHIEQLEALLEGMQRCEEVMSTPNRIKAIEYAISSIKTDLKYDLMYENDEDTVFLTKEAYAALCARASGIITEGTTKNDLGVDCVARQDIERYIEGFINEYTPKEELEFINLELDGLKHLPSVTPQEPRWIHVSERLPKPFMYVNATCRSLVDDREDWVVETVYLPIPKEVNKHGYSDWGNIPMINWGKAEVIAWMERIIPEPYVREDNTDKEQKDDKRRIKRLCR